MSVGMAILITSVVVAVLSAVAYFLFDGSWKHDWIAGLGKIFFWITAPVAALFLLALVVPEKPEQPQTAPWAGTGVVDSKKFTGAGCREQTVAGDGIVAPYYTYQSCWGDTWVLHVVDDQGKAHDVNVDGATYEKTPTGSMYEVTR